MNSENHSRKKQSGNAMIYVILALALLAALTLAISNQNEEAGNDLSAEQVEILTTKTLTYAGSAKNVIDQMTMSGTDPASLSFTRPNVPSYDTAPHINKVFHPEGGGLTYEAAQSNIFPGVVLNPARGWYINGETNIEWTPTAENDVMIVAYGLSSSICASINKKIKNDTTIPVVTGIFEDILLSAEDNGGGGVLDTTSCADCEGYPALCVSNVGASLFAYYNIILAQ